MRARTVLLLIVALILAGGTTMMARVWLLSQQAAKNAASPIAVPTPSKSVLIARSSLQRGQILRPDDMAWEPWPEGGIGKNYILIGTRTPEAYAGWVARDPISAGEPLTESKIIAPGNRGFLAAVLHPGMRAVSVPVTVTSGISGFVFPGDQVDLIVTYSVPDRAQGSTTNSGPLLEHKISETVLQNVRVIAIDQKLDSKPGEAVVAKTTTFEVTPKESEVVALASEMGKLSLSLRSLVPGPDEPKRELNVSSLGGLDSPLPETHTVDSDVSPFLRNPDAKPGSKATETVTILRGGGQSTAAAPSAAPPQQ